MGNCFLDEMLKVELKPFTKFHLILPQLTHFQPEVPSSPVHYYALLCVIVAGLKI